MKKIREFCATHPKEIMAGIALVVGGAVINTVSERTANENDGGASSIDWPLEINNLDDNSYSANSENLDVAEEPENGEKDNCIDSSISTDCPEKRPYTPNDVPAGGQHYNTKEGRVWREKAGYHRGDKQDNC